MGETTAVVTGSSYGGLVDRLRKSFGDGSGRTLEWRRARLNEMAVLLREGEKELAAALAADLGKPALESWVTDISFVLNEISMMEKALPGWMKPRRVSLPLVQRPGRGYIVPQPLGVALVIAPWNYPVQLLLLPMASALAAGNAVVGKPSEITPRTSEVLGRLSARYLDQDAASMVEGGPEETTALLEERFDHIFYTGNGRVGRIVMAAAAKHLTPVTLELGGKSPAIVAADADIEVAARRITWAKFLNAGQTCVAPDYVLVERSVEERLCQALAASVRAMYGTDPALSADYGRIVSDRHFQRLSGLLERAGGRVVVGGRSQAATRYIEPTVVAGLDEESSLMEEEIFGPLLPVLAVDSVDEAVEVVNRRDKPLALYVFSQSREVSHRVLVATSSGGACVNHALMHLAVPELPFGGVGESGMGAYHGRRGFETFSHMRSVLERPTRPDPSIAYPPYGRLKARLLRRLM
jgi:aldehyde dehydrogenase (NAD+)